MPGPNEIQVFAPNGLTANGDVMDVADYTADPQRLIGHQAGMARRELENTALRQVSRFSAGTADFLAKYYPAGVVDDGDAAKIIEAWEDSVQALIEGASIPTPPQFDDDTSIATTAFVQRALGNLRGVVEYTGSGTLTAADHAGVLVRCLTNGATITLPAAGSVTAGTTFHVQATAAAGATVVSPSGSFSGPDGPSPGSANKVLGAGASCKFISLGVAWYAEGGGGFQNFAASGWQRLTSGLLIEWGQWTSSGTAGNPVAVTFPLAFGTSIFSVVVSATNSATANSAAWFDTPTLTGFNGRCIIVNRPCYYVAVGY